MKNCKVADMEKQAETIAAAAVGKKRKPSLSMTSSGELKTPRLAVVTPENSSSPSSSGELTCESLNSGLALASCCSSNRSSELAKSSSKFADLEEMTEVFATSAGHSVDFRDSRETSTPVSQVQADSSKLESNYHLRSTTAIMPSEDELEEFFAAAEKNLQKQFTDKYNYDIVKDEPLEGRYEWVQIQLKP